MKQASMKSTANIVISPLRVRLIFRRRCGVLAGFLISQSSIETAWEDCDALLYLRKIPVEQQVELFSLCIPSQSNLLKNLRISVLVISIPMNSTVATADA